MYIEVCIQLCIYIFTYKDGSKIKSGKSVKIIDYYKNYYSGVILTIVLYHITIEENRIKYNYLFKMNVHYSFLK